MLDLQVPLNSIPHTHCAHHGVHRHESALINATDLDKILNVLAYSLSTHAMATEDGYKSGILIYPSVKYTDH